MVKKILLLGGSAQQVVAIDTAKKMGYYTILCDYLRDNPGQYHADKFYLVSTTNKEEVLNVAKQENVDGILAYASDPAAPTAAYVAEKMDLPTNPYRSVYILCNKDRFRTFLKKNGFNTPQAKSYIDKQSALSEGGKFSLPVIVKPVDSSGSKGVTVLYDWKRYSEALDYAFSFSRSSHIIVEEYVEKKHPYIIGGDIFITNGKINLWGLLNCHRDNSVNPLVPVGKSFPLALEKEDIRRVKETITNLMSALHIKFGSVNVELIIDKQNRVWPIDIGPRAGGNMIPDLLGMIFEVDVIKMAILAAMGEKTSISISEGLPFMATHNLHSNRDGIYKGIRFEERLNNYIIKKCIYKRSGDRIRRFNNASDALGIIFLKFPNEKEMYDVLQNINKYIIVDIEE